MAKKLRAFENNINICKSLYENNKNAKTTFLFIYRYYIGYRLSNKRENLSNALNIAVTFFNENNTDIDFLFIVIFLCIENDEMLKAKDILDSLKDNKIYFKKNEPENFIILNFLEAFFKIKNGDKKAIKKYKKTFESIENLENNILAKVLLGIIEFSNGNYLEAVSYFTHKPNKYKAFINLYLQDIYNTGVEIKDKEIFIEFLNWAVFQGANLYSILNFYEDFIKEEVYAGINFYKKIYEDYSFDWALITICQKIKEFGDTSFESLNYFVEAEKKSLLTLSYLDFYMKLLIENDSHSISQKSLKLYLESANIDDKLLEYIYYLVVTSKNSEILLRDYRDKIMEYAVSGIENNLRNKNLLSIYVFYLKNAEPNENNLNLLNKAKNIIESEIFFYDAKSNNDEIKKIWVIEDEKKDIGIYDFVNMEVSFQASTTNFRYVCLDSKDRRIIDRPIKIKRRIKNYDIKFLEKFYGLGGRNYNLLIALSSDYIKKNILNQNYLDILKNTLMIKDLSIDLKIKINLCIGEIYSSKNDFKNAFEYFSKVDEANISKEFAKSVLNTFVEIKDFEKAASFIIKKYSFIPENNLFYFVKEIVRNNIFKKELSEICFNLILNSWYDKDLEEVVLNYFVGSQSDWENIHRVLKSLSIETKIVEEKILLNALKIKKFDLSTQHYFKMLYEKDKKNKLVNEFIYFTIYNIIYDNTFVESDTISILEEVLTETEDNLLCIAISLAYIRDGFLKKEIISKSIKILEKENILFPAFKNLKDNSITTPYIEMNQPFIYKTYPDKKVFLFYKFENDDEFSKVQMRYFKFGIFVENLISFFGDKITYYFSEDSSSGSVSSAEKVFENTKISLNEKLDSLYYKINNALVYEKTLKFDNALDMIDKIYEKPLKIKGKLL